MVIQRREPRNPRRGPSCLFVLFIAAASILGGFVIANADEVRDTFTVAPTPAATRSAVSYATSASLLASDGEYDEAISAYEVAIELSEDNAAFYLPLIDLLLLRGRPDEALSWAEKATELIPDDDRAWTALAASKLNNGYRLEETGQRTDADLSYQEAVNAGERAVQINPQNAEAYAYMAGGLAQLGRATFNYGEAQEKAEFALALDPESIVVRRQMAILFELQGYYDAAIEQYEIARQLNPNLVSLDINLAFLYFFTERRQEGILTLLGATEKDPDNADAYAGLGYFYFIIGEYSRAEEYAREAVRLDPEMTRAHSFLGAAYFKNNNYPEAIKELEQAVARYKTPSSQNATYFNMLGLAYYFTDSENCDKAVPIFNAVLEVAIANSPAEFNANEGLDLCRQAALERLP